VRTTLSISDGLLDLAKKASRERRITLGEMVEEALRLTLAVRTKSCEQPERPQLITFDGTGLMPGVDLDSSASLLESMEARS
jgi:hypothetical protein